MQSRTKVILKPGREQSLRRMHPWVFSGAIGRIEDKPEEGDEVAVYAHTGDFLALGHYQIGSIAIRAFTFLEEETGTAFWLRKFQDAFALRQVLGLASGSNTDAYRLINGEGDGMPGIIADFYNGVLVIQFHSVGMYNNREMFAGLLTGVFGDALKAVYEKSRNTLPAILAEGIGEDYLMRRPEFCPGDHLIRENGFKFNVDYANGQKTGFFIDQRENRALLQKLCKGHEVLNMFSYTGGFSVYALGGGANLVHSVDSSAPAIKLVNENVALNFGADNRHKAFTDDAFRYLDRHARDYNLIVLDPPAFAKRTGALNNALKGYRRLNQVALENIRKGGLLFTFSCSQVVSPDDFRSAVFAAAANTGRQVTLLYRLTQPADHPVSLFHPEGDYLKGLVLRVD